jgi:streptogrisin C
MYLSMKQAFHTVHWRGGTPPGNRGGANCKASFAIAGIRHTKEDQLRRRRFSMLSRNHFTAILAASVGICIIVSMSGPANAVVKSLTTSTIDPATVYESMHYLMARYGVSKQEALRRLELQKTADEIDANLRTAIPDEYGGWHLDQAGGGILVVAMTNPGDAAPYVAGLADRAHVATRKVEHSLRELTQVRDRIGKQVHEGADAVYLPVVDGVSNKVVLLRRDWVADEKLAGTWEISSLGKTSERSAAERGQDVAEEKRAAKAAVDAENTKLVVERALPKPGQSYNPFVDWGFCHPLYCPYWYGPVGGGMRMDIMRDDGQWGGCTLGYNMRSTGAPWNGWAWGLTAGHCVAGKTNQAKIQHDGWDIWVQHGLERNSYPYDYAILPFNGGAASQTWLDNFTGRNRILKYCRNGGLDSDANTQCGPQATSQSEYITGYRPLINIGQGEVVCASGSGSSATNYPDSWDSGAGGGYLVGTRCGVVLSTDVGINTDICARAGDSGGPLFSQTNHLAYGILEGNLQNRVGPCDWNEVNNYSPISTILADVNYQSGGNSSGTGIYYLFGGTTVNLITTSTG